MNNTDFRYTGNLCPVCNENFNPEDDIVVCPLCGTPHHRQCYKQNGECANNEKHSEGYRWESVKITPPPSNESAENSIPPFTPYTPQGETNNSRTAASTVFWANQQNPFDAYPKELADGVSTEETAEFIQMNAFKYLQNFFLQKTGKKAFNWAAFFFAPYWFFYRKLYKLGAIFMTALLLVSVVFSFIPSVQQFNNDIYEWQAKYSDTSSLSQEEIETAASEIKTLYTENLSGIVLTLVANGLSIGIQLYIGFNANKWYKDHTISKIRKIKDETAETELQKLNFYKQGGMSMGHAFLAVLANNVVVMAINMLFTALNK